VLIYYDMDERKKQIQRHHDGHVVEPLLSEHEDPDDLRRIMEVVVGKDVGRLALPSGPDQRLKQLEQGQSVSKEKNEN